jgi:hypothetical protein
MKSFLCLFFFLRVFAGAQALQSAPSSVTPGSQTSRAGFQQNGSITVVYPDDQLRLWLNPEQFGAAGTGSGENGDDCEAINLAIRNAALGSGLNTPKVVHLNGRNYRCSGANYQILMPRDFGDYSAASAGEGAQFSLNIVNGSIQSCDISGGRGYNPKGWVIAQIKDATYSGSGGAAHALTDSKGVPVPGSCTVDSPGINYPPTGVDVYSFAQGADGARVIATLSNGTFTSASSLANDSAMPQGNGYKSVSFGLPAGLACNVKPQFSGSVGSSGLSKSALATVSITIAGSGCTYKGAASATVPIWVGGSTDGGTAQASNLAPSPAMTIGCAIQLRAGVSIEGDGATIQTDWQKGIYGAKQIVAFCDAYGNQARDVSVRNLHIAAPAGIWLTGRATNFVVENVTEQYASPRAHVTKTYLPGPGGGLFFYAAQTGAGTVIRNISNYSSGGIVVGGQYTSRGDAGLGSAGGADVSRNDGASTSQAGGSADELIVDNFRQYQLNGNSYNPALDQFFEQYVWHADYTPASSPNAPNGLGTCPTTLAANLRSVDNLFGPGASRQFQCYRGISDRAVTILSRSPYVSRHLNISNVWQEKSHRSSIIASATESRFSMINLSALGEDYKDPYVAPGTNAIGVIENPTNLASGPVNTFEGIFNGDSAHKYFTRTLVATSLSDDRTRASSWTMVSGMPSGGRVVTIQNTFHQPGALRYTHGLGTLNPISNCYSTEAKSLPVVTLIEGDRNDVNVTSSSPGTVVCIFQFAPEPGAY